eukprot:scaffold69155_cov69-Phaeocystis_antarctica.AAC.3
MSPGLLPRRRSARRFGTSRVSQVLNDTACFAWDWFMRDTSCRSQSANHEHSWSFNEKLTNAQALHVSHARKHPRSVAASKAPLAVLNWDCGHCALPPTNVVTPQMPRV